MEVNLLSERASLTQGFGSTGIESPLGLSDDSHSFLTQATIKFISLAPLTKNLNNGDVGARYPVLPLEAQA